MPTTTTRAAPALTDSDWLTPLYYSLADVAQMSVDSGLPEAVLLSQMSRLEQAGLVRRTWELAGDQPVWDLTDRGLALLRDTGAIDA